MLHAAIIQYLQFSSKLINKGQGGQVTIRPYCDEDASVVVDIANRVYCEMLGENLFAALFPESETRAGRNVMADIEKHPDQTIVCESDGCVVGFCNYWLDATKKVGTASRC